MSAPPAYHNHPPHDPNQPQYYNQQQPQHYPPQQQPQHYPPQQQQQPQHYPPQQQPQPDYPPPGDTSGGMHVENSPHELDFGDEKPQKFRDPCCGATFVIQLLILLIVSFVYIGRVQSRDFLYYDYSFNIDGYITAMLCASGAVGILFAVCWLAVLRKIPGKVIRASIITHMVLYLALTVVAFYFAIYILAVICLILVLIWALYFCCIYKRIKFSEKMIKYSIKGISKYWGVFIVALLNAIWMTAFSTLWVMGVCSVLAITYTDDMVDNVGPRDGVYAAIWVIFVFFYFWNMETFSNISHLVNCGVMGHWWFQTEDAKNITLYSFKRATTYSLGSVAFGSLLVAIVRFMRFLVSSSGGNRNLCGAILLCFLGCIERLMEYFNTYAFANVAIYGMTYIEGAKACMKMFKAHGLTMIINDDLTSLALILGCLVGGLVTCAGVGTPFYFITKDHYHDHDGFYIAPFFFAFFIGFYAVRMFLSQVSSAVVASFTCLAMDPHLMQTTRPDEYKKIQKARSKFYK